MSYESRKGYSAEHDLLTFLAPIFGEHLYRPRAGAPQDRGDIIGLPFVLSVKNHSRLDLSDWIKGLDSMVAAAGVEAGVVVHKRVRTGSPSGWYVTTSVRLALPFFRSYVERVK